MALLDDLHEARISEGYNRPGSCLFCRRMAQMTTTEATAIRKAVKAGMSLELIVAVMSKNGYQVGLTTARAHKRQGHDA